MICSSIIKQESYNTLKYVIIGVVIVSFKVYSDIPLHRNEVKLAEGMVS